MLATLHQPHSVYYSTSNMHVYQKIKQQSCNNQIHNCIICIYIYTVYTKRFKGYCPLPQLNVNFTSFTKGSA